MGPTQQVVEQLAAVFIRMEPIIDIGLKTGVNVSIIQFAVQNQENLVWNWIMN